MNNDFFNITMIILLMLHFPMGIKGLSYLPRKKRLNCPREKGPKFLEGKISLVEKMTTFPWGTSS
jgi:hypothetical protein